VELYYKGERLTTHNRFPDYMKNKYSTHPEDMLHTARLSGRFCAAQWPDCANSGRLVKKILCRERLFT
jgi:hypothetical protein